MMIDGNVEGETEAEGGKMERNLTDVEANERGRRVGSVHGHCSEPVSCQLQNGLKNDSTLPTVSCMCFNGIRIHTKNLFKSY